MARCGPPRARFQPRSRNIPRSCWAVGSMSLVALQTTVPQVATYFSVRETARPGGTKLRSPQVSSIPNPAVIILVALSWARRCSLSAASGAARCTVARTAQSGSQRRRSSFPGSMVHICALPSKRFYTREVTVAYGPVSPARCIVCKMGRPGQPKHRCRLALTHAKRLARSSSSSAA